MNNDFFKVIIRFLILISSQILFANQLHLFGYLIPQISVLFVFWFPLEKNIFKLLICTFIFGITLDIFNNSGGINTFSLLLIAYIKLPTIKYIFDEKMLDCKLFNYKNYSFLKKIVFIFFLTFIHQLSIYCLDYFHYKYTGIILLKTFLNSLLSTFFITICFYLFKTR